MTKYFDPLDYENIGESISRALESQPLIPLEHLDAFDGAGVYALYYTGLFPAYKPLALSNIAEPGSWAIYIGRAEAENHRKGDPDQVNNPVGPKLFRRIREHRNSINAARNLSLSDFQFRALALAPTWVPLAEVISVKRNKPVWNSILDGLGNHAPGKGRNAGERPKWDTMHPGRPWASGLKPHRISQAELIEMCLNYLAKGHPQSWDEDPLSLRN